MRMKTKDDIGFVKLVDVLGSDERIVEAARIGKESKQPWVKTLRYMMRERHTSPFEFASLIIHVRLPIFVARQWMRHRAGVFNEVSARYSEVPEGYWTPKEWRGQGKTNRQSSEGLTLHRPLQVMHEHHFTPFGSFDQMDVEKAARLEYEKRIQDGVSREQARSCLPLSTYTEFYWGVNLHNFMHFLDLRADEHAQPEIQEYANLLISIFKDNFPETHRAWLDYRKNGVTLSALDIAVIKGEEVVFDSVSEMELCQKKLAKLGYMMVNVSEPKWKIVDPAEAPKPKSIFDGMDISPDGKHVAGGW